MAVSSISGLDTVLSNLNREIQGIKDRSMASLIRSGLRIQRVSQQRTPVDTGNLRASAFTRREGFNVQIGYTAAYALFVHEDMEAHHKTGQAKFLETAFNDEMAGVLESIRKEASV